MTNSLRVLVSTTQGQGAVPGDFTWTDDGEVVVHGGYAACDSHRLYEPGEVTRCGCDRAFKGISTGKSTTTAAVAHIDSTRDALVDTLATRLFTAWGNGDEDPELRELAESLIDDMLDIAGDMPEGRTIGQDVDSVFTRA